MVLNNVYFLIISYQRQENVIIVKEAKETKVKTNKNKIFKN